MKKLLSVKETSELLGLKVSTLYAWVHRKKIPYVKAGGKLKFIEEQMNCFIEANNFIPNERLVNIDFKDTTNREVLRQVFKAKDVNLNLLSLLKDKRKIHEDDFRSVLQADLRQKGRPEYSITISKYTLNLISALEEFWVK